MARLRALHVYRTVARYVASKREGLLDQRARNAPTIVVNPKLGLDWMNHGEQKLVMTPGKNEKAYVAGTLDARTRHVPWVGAGEKNSALFIAMLRKLDARYAEAVLIHVVLDN